MPSEGAGGGEDGRCPQGLPKSRQEGLEDVDSGVEPVRGDPCSCFDSPAD